MENIIEPVSSANSSETLNDSDLRNSHGEGLDMQRSLVKQKETELKEMQEQIETYNQMVKQLASQREMAVKRLADMDTQIAELNMILERERSLVEAKDRELKTKRTQLQTLKNEESELKEKFSNYKQELGATTENLTNTQLQETQIKTKLVEIQEFINTTNTAMDDIKKAIDIKDTIKLSALCNQMLTLPLSINTQLTNGMKSPSQQQSATTTTPATSNQPFDQPNRQNNENYDSLFDSSTNFDPFADDDPFNGDDPFKAEDVQVSLDEDDPFNPTSSAASSTGFILAQNDPFAPHPPNLGGF